MSLKIAILGAGFIGLNLTKTFLKLGYNVSVLNRSAPSQGFSHPNLVWVQGDVGCKSDIDSVLAGADVVFYLVSSTVPGDDVDVSKELFLNVSQLLQVLEQCEYHKIQKFIFFSSSSVYGAQLQFPISESSVPLPISAHGIQKLTMEYYIGLFSRRSTVDCKILRLSNPFGPGQNIHGRQGFISIVIGHLKSGTPVSIRGTGEDVRDYIYIDDVVDACANLVITESSELVFNMGCGEGYTLNQVLEIFEEQLGYPVPVEHIACRESDIPVSVLDTSKMQSEFGCIDTSSLAAGINQFLVHHSLVVGEKR